MSACNAELCANWTGHGCICEVMGIEHDDPPKCAQCGFTAYELDVMDFGPYVGQLICDECWDATEPALETP